MLLSVIIPSYNHEKFVLSTIRAAVRIDVANKEIIVIDDGSTDESVRILREYIASAGDGSNIRLIARENRGLVRTLNEGLSISRGKYIYLVASDDIPIPDGIASLVAILEKNSDLQLVLGNVLVMDSEEQREFRRTYGEAHRRFFTISYEERLEQMFLRYPQPILLQSAVFKAAALKAIGGWREDIVVDDLSLFLRMLSRHRNAGKDFAYHPEIIACFYRQHPSNSYRNLMRQFTMIEQALVQLCPPEWLNAALFRNFALHGRDAVRGREPLLAVQMFYSTVGHVGFGQLMRTSARELRGIAAARLTRRRANGVEPTILHESAANMLDRPRNR